MVIIFVEKRSVVKKGGDMAESICFGAKKGRVGRVNFNLYHYAGNSPVKYTDPDGRDDEIYNSSGELIEIKKSKTNDAYLRVPYDEDTSTAEHDVFLSDLKTFHDLSNSVYKECAGVRKGKSTQIELQIARSAIAHVALNRLAKNMDIGMGSDSSSPNNIIEQRERNNANNAVIRALTDSIDFTFGAIHFNLRESSLKNPTTSPHKSFGDVTSSYGPFCNPAGGGDLKKGSDFYIVTYEGIK